MGNNILLLKKGTNDTILRGENRSSIFADSEGKTSCVFHILAAHGLIKSDEICCRLLGSSCLQPKQALRYHVAWCRTKNFISKFRCFKSFPHHNHMPSQFQKSRTSSKCGIGWTDLASIFLIAFLILTGT